MGEDTTPGQYRGEFVFRGEGLCNCHHLFLKKHDIRVPLVELPQNEYKRNFVRGREAKIMMILKARTI